VLWIWLWAGGRKLPKPASMMTSHGNPGKSLASPGFRVLIYQMWEWVSVAASLRFPSSGSNNRNSELGPASNSTAILAHSLSPGRVQPQAAGLVLGHASFF
jgi:hypothetical protein